MKHKKLFVITLILILLVCINHSNAENTVNESPTVKINIQPYSLVYEGDIIDCEITGNPSIKYWTVNNQTPHHTFYNNNAVIFDPELTPIEDEYVDLKVFVENNYGSDSDTIPVKIKRIFFGDIHWHTNYGDGINDIEKMYENAISDNYLDFAASSEHTSNILAYGGKKFPILTMLKDYLTKQDPWNMIKKLAIDYYDPGNFTTILGYEWSVSTGSPGGYKWSENGYDDVGHINFYYKDVYPDAPRYNSYQKHTYDDIFKAMSDEWDKGHYNICYPHHPLGQIYWLSIGDFRFFNYKYNTNWSFLAKKIKQNDARDKILRGVEVYSRWGNSIGKYSDLPIPWPYHPDQPPYTLCMSDQREAWVENAMWEWSADDFVGKRFVMQAGSDTHVVSRPGSAEVKDDKEKVSGLIAAYAVHNTRSEIWDAMNECNIYASHALKIRANVRIEDEISYGRWINSSGPLNINITSLSTFPGVDSSGKKMCPHGYQEDQLNYPISDIWIIKKDTSKGRPWCKTIYHESYDEDLVVLNFIDPDVEPNDFYYIAIMQKGQEIVENQDDYMAYIGPVFIENVT